MKSKSCFPNLLAEMARRGLTLSGMPRSSADPVTHSRGTSTVRCALPDALRIRDRYFPDCSLDYLFDRR